jgi:hypothetical protein
MRTLKHAGDIPKVDPMKLDIPCALRVVPFKIAGCHVSLGTSNSRPAKQGALHCADLSPSAPYRPKPALGLTSRYFNICADPMWRPHLGGKKGRLSLSILLLRPPRDHGMLTLFQHTSVYTSVSVLSRAVCALSALRTSRESPTQRRFAAPTSPCRGGKEKVEALWIAGTTRHTAALGVIRPIFRTVHRIGRHQSHAVSASVPR